MLYSSENEKKNSLQLKSAFSFDSSQYNPEEPDSAESDGGRKGSRFSARGRQTGSRRSARNRRSSSEEEEESVTSDEDFSDEPKKRTKPAPRGASNVGRRGRRSGRRAKDSESEEEASESESDQSEEVCLSSANNLRLNLTKFFQFFRFPFYLLIAKGGTKTEDTCKE